jgi:hypothetical protein
VRWAKQRPLSVHCWETTRSSVKGIFNTRNPRQRCKRNASTRLQNELEAEERKEAIERNEAHVEARVAAEAGREEAAAKATEAAQKRAADAAEHAALQQRADELGDAARLEQQARSAATLADTIDPDVK